MNVLVVGAGAVGQVYGRHLQLGGATVSVLVKPKYADEARRGFDLYPWNAKRRPARFESFAVLTTMDEVAAARWDAVVLCVSSTALRAGTWFDELARRLGDATLVTLQPGLTDHDYVTARVPAAQVVAGMIGLIAYAAPLAGESVPRPGTAYWFPPLSACPFSGPPERARAIVAAFRRGKFPAKLHRDAPAATAFGAAVLGTHMVALECADWSFRTLRRDRELLGMATRAAREASTITARFRKVRPPRLLGAIGPLETKLALRLAPHVVPLDLERFFRAHYTKVADQTRDMLGTYADLAARLGVETPALGALRARLEARA